MRYTGHILICILVGLAFTKLGGMLEERPAIVYLFLDAKVRYNDTFTLYYQAEGDADFSKEHSARAQVQGQDGFQKIGFEIPGNIVLKRLKFALGNFLDKDSTHATMRVRSMMFGNPEIRLTYSGEDLVKFAQPSYNISTFANDGAIVTYIAENYEPQLIASDVSTQWSMLTKSTWTVPIIPWLLVGVFLTVCFSVFAFVPLSARFDSAVKLSAIALFSGALLLPVLGGLLDLDKSDKLMEKRTLASRPPFQLSTEYSKGFEAWFSDNFAFRPALISIDSKIRVDYFKASNSDKALPGKNGWLYYNNNSGETGDYIFRSYAHLNLMNDNELKEYVDRIAEHTSACKKNGIEFIRGFCPQTQTIYPENMPFMMKIQVRGKVSRADQIAGYIKKNYPNIKFVDMRPALFAEKKHHQIYRRLDTHWNDYGAFIGYTALLNQSFDQLHVKPVPISNYKIEWIPDGGGDLVNMLGGNISNMDTVPRFTQTGQSIAYYEIPADGLPANSKITVCSTAEDSRTVVIFRDSYTDALIQFLSPHFKKIIYIPFIYRQEIVDQVKPQIVIEIPVERYL